MARPSKLTPEVEERILKALRAGNYATAAARYAGIHPSTSTAGSNAGIPAAAAAPTSRTAASPRRSNKRSPRPRSATSR
jgi:hypothetical protein